MQPARPGDRARPTGAGGITLGTDLAVGNGFAETVVTTKPSAGATAVAIDGYQVQMTGSPAVGESMLNFSVPSFGLQPSSAT